MLELRNPFTNDLSNILIPSRNEMKNRHILEDRSTIYGCIAALFSDPSTEKFDLVLNEDFQQDVLVACYHIDKSSNNCKQSLTKLFSNVLKQLSIKDREATAGELVKLFGHTLSKQLAPYELEHLSNEDVFFRTQKLADLNGFYRGFGLEVNPIERSDHIATQSEFLSFLIIKEFLALSNSNQDNIEVCHNACLSFLKEHFIDWVEIFSDNLIKVSRTGLYSDIGQFLKEFLSREKLLIAEEGAIDTGSIR